MGAANSVLISSTNLRQTKKPDARKRIGLFSFTAPKGVGSSPASEACGVRRALTKGEPY